MRDFTEEWIAFHPRYLTGITEIDDQHRALFTIINTLYRDLHSVKRERAEAFGEAARNAVKYAVDHFGMEERFMAGIGYPGLAAQREAHGEYARNLLAEVKAFERGDTLAPSRFIRYLRDWIESHIIYEDRAIATFLAQRSDKA